MAEREKRRARLQINIGRLDHNSHDWSDGKKGETIHGWKVTRVKLDVHSPSTGYRYILYFPSGAWWHIDFNFDRRGIAGLRPIGISAWGWRRSR